MVITVCKESTCRKPLLPDAAQLERMEKNGWSVHKEAAERKSALAKTAAQAGMSVADLKALSQL